MILNQHIECIWGYIAANLNGEASHSFPGISMGKISFAESL